MLTTSTYCVKEGYIIRPNPDFDDERGKTDECQNGVYLHARQWANELGLRSVVDVGTGGGFKLMKYFEDMDTLGIDMPQTVAWLRETYPKRAWAIAPMEHAPWCDMVICSDVIEHLVDPEPLLAFIKQCRAKAIVISTPDRDKLAEHSWGGPPRNLCHVREWSFKEFGEYMGQHFTVIKQFYPEAMPTSTMCVFAR